MIANYGQPADIDEIRLNSRGNIRRARSHSRELTGMPVHLLGTRRQRTGEDVAGQYMVNRCPFSVNLLSKFSMNSTHYLLP